MTIVTSDDGIQIELHGGEQFWALRARVQVPLETITGVSFAEKFQDWRKWEVRMPGSNVPSQVLAGSFWTETGWDFLYIKRPHGFIKPLAENVLIITTNQSRYNRVIVSCAPERAEEIMAWWQDRRST